MAKICQSCGKEINQGEEAVSVSYGCMHWKSGRFYNTRGVDYFHLTCDKAFRTSDDKVVR